MEKGCDSEAREAGNGSRRQANQLRVRGGVASSFNQIDQGARKGEQRA